MDSLCLDCGKLFNEVYLVRLECGHEFSDVEGKFGADVFLSMNSR